MHMLHNIVNGHPMSPVSLSGSVGGEEDGEGGDEDRKLNHNVGAQSPILTSKGNQAEDERQALIDRIIAENQKLKAELGNNVAK